jgi:hypothetical protein
MDDIEHLTTRVIKAMMTASPEALRSLAVPDRDIHRETVQAFLDERGEFVDPLGLCADLDPTLTS